jgi:hypothetical protein
VSKAMDTIWSNKAPERCSECYKKIGDVFYDAKIFACEWFRQMQVCENCFERSRAGRPSGPRAVKLSRLFIDRSDSKI